MKRNLTLAGLGIVVAGTFASTSSAHAEERICRGTIGAVTVDNLAVPTNATVHTQGHQRQRHDQGRERGATHGEQRSCGRQHPGRGSRVGQRVVVHGGRQHPAQARRNGCDPFQQGDRRRPIVQQPRNPDDLEQPHQRQPSVQVELAGTHRDRKRRRREQRGSVPAVVTHVEHLAKHASRRLQLHKARDVKSTGPSVQQSAGRTETMPRPWVGHRRIKPGADPARNSSPTSAWHRSRRIAAAWTRSPRTALGAAAHASVSLAALSTLDERTLICLSSMDNGGRLRSAR